MRMVGRELLKETGGSMLFNNKSLIRRQKNNVSDKVVGRIFRCKSNQGGFSLIEVLVAITILAVVSLPIISAFMTSSKVNLRARRQENANTVGQKVSENFKSLTLTDILKTTDAKNVTMTTSAATNQTIYNFNMGSYNYLGNTYSASDSGDEFYVTVELNPDDFADKNTVEEASKDNTNNNVNSFNMPSFSDLQEDKNFVIMRQVYENDNAALLELGCSPADMYRKVDLYVDVTDKIPGTNTLNVTSEGYKMYTQSVRMVITYCVFGDTSRTKTYTYDIGSTEIKGNVADEQYFNVYLFYNAYDRNRTDAQKDKSRDVINFHVNDGDATNSKFNTAMDINGKAMKDKQINLYLIEQTVKNASDPSITLKLQTSNISMKSGSSYNIQGMDLAKKTLGIGVNSNINILTNATCIQTYKSTVVHESDKTFNNATNTITQEIDPNTEIKYLYNMTVKIWINEKPSDGSEPFLTLQSTKENAREKKESAHE